MAHKMGTQDKARARALRRRLLQASVTFQGSTDLGDRADRYGPDMATLVAELATLEGWDNP